MGLIVCTTIMPRAPETGGKRGIFMNQAALFLELFTLVWGVSAACKSAARTRPSATASPGSGGHNFQDDKQPYKQRMQPADFWMTEWGRLLRNPDVREPGTKEHKEFVAEFRVPFSIFEEIINDCHGQKWTRCSTRKGKRIRGRPSLPLESKVLGCLYRLGSGCLPRTVARLFGSSAATANTFFLDFCAFYAQQYGETCRVPVTEAERRDLEEVYAKMGFPGCLGVIVGCCFPQLYCLLYMLQLTLLSSSQDP